jgi:choline dehydrogenase-like flavoprotein
VYVTGKFANRNANLAIAQITLEGAEIFTLATHLCEKYGAARLPENLAVQDWGLIYDDLEPYYWRAEQMMGVGGPRNAIGRWRNNFATG